MRKKNKRRTVFVNANPTVTMATAAPIDMKNFPEIDKTPAKKQSKKAETKTEIKKHDVLNDPPADIKAWKENVMIAVEAVLDAAIKEVVNA